MGERLEPEVDLEGFNDSRETTRQERVANFAAKALSYIPGHPGTDLHRTTYYRNGTYEGTTYVYRRPTTGELIRTKTRQDDEAKASQYGGIDIIPKR